ncbi:MAG: phosphoribosylanthranilate isomerase [Acidimicrobiia bacterium]|nr:phosphoribosylanthranilate isomerase [Acidimicrobiia bacterium]
MMVKVCGITNREDAEAAIEAGVSALGFNFWTGSPRYVHAETAGSLVECVPEGVLKVGLFVNADAVEVAEVAARLGLDVVQLHGEAEAPAGLRVWRAVAVKDGFRAEHLGDQAAEAFLLDAPAGERHGGTGKTFEWKLVQATGRRIIVAGGLDASNVREAIAVVQPWGVDACSRLESAPGRKDHAKMREFIKAAVS